MSNQNKTHFRKVFKSDHLGCADLEDFVEQKHNLIFNIKHVRQEYGTKVAGKKIDANIAYFAEGIKPLVLNATNSNAMKGLTNSSFVEDWVNVPVQLYIDSNVRMKGQTVGGVRISHQAPRQRQLVEPKNVQMWERAKTAFKRDGNLSAVLASADMSDQHQTLLIQECS